MLAWQYLLVVANQDEVLSGWHEARHHVGL